MVDTGSYNPSKAKPKINIAPSFQAADMAPPLAEDNTTETQLDAPPRKPVKSACYTYSSGWDIRFAVGLVLAIMLVNTALVILFSDDTTPSPDSLSPSAGSPTLLDEDGAPYTKSPPLTRPVRTSRDLAQDGPSGSTTEVYVTQEQRQLLLRQLNGVTTEPSDGIDPQDHR